MLGRVVPSIVLAESYNALLAMMVFGVSASIFLLYFDKKEENKLSVLYYLVLISSLTFMVILPDAYAFITLALVLGYFALTQKNFNFNENVVSITAVSVLTIIISVLHYLPPIRESLGFTPLTSIPRLDVVSSWYVAASNLIGRPFWGVGLNNYATAFSEFRPAYLNAGEFWNARYAYAFNDIFGWLTTAGLVGVIGYLSFIYLVVRKGISKESESKDSLLGVLGVVLVAVLLLLGSSVALYVMLFVIAASLFQNNRGFCFCIKISRIINCLYDCFYYFNGGI